MSEEMQTQDNPRTMMALALTNNADPEVLKKLMDLQERWDANVARKAYVKAMAEFKKECPAVLVKDARVDFSSAKGRTTYNHATLGGIVAKITTMLSKHGLHASWETHQDPSVVTVTCHITHEEGHRESTSLAGPPDDSGNKNRIQMIGSSVTYLQRYTLLAALGLATANQDDADDRQPPAMPTERKQESAPQQPAGDKPKNAISEAQGKRLFAIASKGCGVEPLRTYLKTMYKIEHTRDIDRADYEAICTWAESTADEPGANG